MTDRTYKLNVAAFLSFVLTDEERAQMLKDIALDRAAIAGGDDAASERVIHPEQAKALSKITDTMDDDTIVLTMLGEVVGHVLREALPELSPYQLTVKSVEYQEPPVKLDPPVGTNVVVIDKRVKTQAAE